MIKYSVFSLLPGFETNTYLVWDDISKEAALIDPSHPGEEPIRLIYDNNINLKYIINTHGHADHIGGNTYFHKQFGAAICIHTYDAAMLSNSRQNLSAYMDFDLVSKEADIILKDNDNLFIGNSSIRILHTPGHTPGGICLLIDKYLFSGDTLFQMDVGRTDLPGGNYETLIDSIKSKLYILPDDTTVFPGHGPSTTIGFEKSNNPYVSD